MKKLTRRIKRRTDRVDEGISKAKARYRLDKTASDKVRDTSRKMYRKSKGSEFELSGSTVLRSLEFVDTHTETLAATNAHNGTKGKYPIIRVTVLAKLCNTTYQTIWRWITQSEQLPEPVLHEIGGQGHGVYHVEEARIVIGAIGEHLRAFKYYRKDHTGTRAKIFDQIEEARNNNYGENTHGTTNPQKARRRIIRRSVG